MLTAQTIPEVRHAVRQARSRGLTVGFVPTMGALHEGHASLIRLARDETGFVVVSIFVNPIQFVPGEDFDRYPRPLDEDLALCRAEGVDVVFNPAVEVMYGRPRLTTVHVERLTGRLCGPLRPGHFDGVTTVVAKLFNIVLPDRAYFGQKDAQQALVIRRMTADLDFPVEIRVGPTVREPSGLALSSRNRYLSDDEKHRALALWTALREAQAMIRNGKTRTADLVARMRQVLEAARPERIDYIDVADATTLEPLETVDRPALIALAAQFGPARLIDNILVDGSGNTVIMENLQVVYKCF